MKIFKTVIVIWLCSFVHLVSAQKLLKAEYFIDTDPSPGKGVSISVTKSDSIDLNSIQIPTTGLGIGTHTLGIRVRDSLGFWSPNYCTPFSILAGTSTNAGANKTKIVLGEYFIDTDPSPGKGISIVGAAGDSIDLNNIQIPTTGLGVGTHTLGIRVRDSLGFWSPNYCTPFSILAGTNSNAGDNKTKIVKGEYFIDIDPSPGKGIAIVGAAGDSIDLTNIQIPITGLGVGTHTLGIRVRDSLGFWSPNYCTPFSILAGTSTNAGANKTKIVLGEYFIDTDPSPGKGIAIVGAAGDSIDLTNIQIPTTGLGIGSHTLGIRVRDSLGFWSPNYCTPFSILNQATQNDSIAPQIITGEYFFGIIDPGYGKGITLSNLPKADSIWDLSNLNIKLDDTLGIGTHYVTIRFLQNNGLWSANNTIPFDVCLSVPSRPTATGEVVCGGSGTATIKATGSASKQYAWYADSYGGTALKSSAVNDSVYTLPAPIKVTTSYWVAQKTANCNSPRTKVTVTVFDVLPTPNAKNVSRCGNGKFELTATGAPVGATYRWFSSDTSKTWLAQGLTYKTDSILATRTFTVATISAGGECQSPVKKTLVAQILACTPQVITFPAVPDLIYGFDNYYVLKATSDKGLKVKYQLVSGPASLSNDTIYPFGIGNVTVYAYQEGDSNSIAAAAAVVRTFRITAGSSTLLVDIPNPLCTGAELKFTATAIKDGKYEWTGPNGFKSSLQNPSIYNVQLSDSGVYRLNVFAPSDTLFTTVIVKVAKSPSKISLYAQQQSLCTKEYTLFTLGDSIKTYQWFYNAKTLVGNTDSILTPTLSGVYSVTGANTAGCGISSSPMYVNVDPDSLPTITKLRNPSKLKASPATKYQWYVNNYFIAGGNLQELSLYVNGRYKLKTIDNKGCEHFSLEYTINDDNLSDLRLEQVQNNTVYLTSLNENEAVISPNPTTDILNIHWDIAPKGNVEILVYNAQGMLVKQLSIPKTKADFDYTLPLTDFSSGLYRIKLAIGEKVYFETVIKE